MHVVFLSVLWFPPISQKYATWYTDYSKLPLGMNKNAIVYMHEALQWTWCPIQSVSLSHAQC